MNAWAQALYEIATGIGPIAAACKFAKLINLFVYKADDRSAFQTVVEMRLRCQYEKNETIQLLIDDKKHLTFMSTNLVGDFFLTDIRVGSNKDLKEDILRSYNGPLSEVNLKVHLKNSTALNCSLGGCFCCWLYFESKRQLPHDCTVKLSLILKLT